MKNEKSTKKILKTKTDWSRLRQEQVNNAPVIYDEDSPETDAVFWANAEKYMPSPKTHISMRLDDDIIAFFKKKGRGYQSKINAVLKAYVHSHSKEGNRHV